MNQRYDDSKLFKTIDFIGRVWPIVAGLIAFIIAFSFMQSNINALVSEASENVKDHKKYDEKFAKVELMAEDLHDIKLFIMKRQ